MLECKHDLYSPADAYQLKGIGDSISKSLEKIIQKPIPDAMALMSQIRNMQRRKGNAAPVISLKSIII